MLHCSHYKPVADLGEGPGGAEGPAPPPPTILGKQEEITDGRTADRASKTTPPPP